MQIGDIKLYNYEPYRNTLKRLNIKQADILKDKTINTQNANRLKNNLPITTDTIDKLCTRLNCQPNDIMQHIDNKINQEKGKANE